MIEYVRGAAEGAEIVGAISTGSLVLAAAGLLTGRQATTHWKYATHLEQYGATYVMQRWVEDGKFIFVLYPGLTLFDLVGALQVMSILEEIDPTSMLFLLAQDSPSTTFG